MLQMLLCSPEEVGLRYPTDERINSLLWMWTMCRNEITRLSAALCRCCLQFPWPGCRNGVPENQTLQLECTGSVACLHYLEDFIQCWCLILALSLNASCRVDITLVVHPSKGFGPSTSCFVHAVESNKRARIIPLLPQPATCSIACVGSAELYSLLV